MIDSYSISPNGLKGYRKFPIIWANKGATGYPLMYLKKPKWMAENVFSELVACIRLDISKELGDKLEQ